MTLRDSHRSIYLAGTPRPRTGRSVAASAHAAQLPLHRVGIPRPGRRFTRSAARLRAFCGLWGHYCCDTCVAFATIAAQCGWHCRRLDLQPLGFSRYPQRFLPSQSCRIIGGSLGSRILPSNLNSAAPANYARARFPDSSARSKGFRNSGKPIPCIRQCSRRWVTDRCPAAPETIN